MKFTSIAELNLNITINLIALRRASQPYKVLMFQHEGTLNATRDKIGNSTAPSEEFFAFFKKAKEERNEPDLVLTPEYSCPWIILEEIIADSSRWPSSEKLWVIGAESIQPKELDELKRKLVSDTLLFQYEDEINKSNKTYVDPVVYLFRVTQTGVDKLMVLIQFKTHHMGVWGPTLNEHDDLILGSVVYTIDNSGNEPGISFITLICSEAMNFATRVGSDAIFNNKWVDKPFLIFHPQCNPRPEHDVFIAFRKFVFTTEFKEIISLNWHQNSKFPMAAMFSESSPRSGFAVKSHEFKYGDTERIKRNHKFGMYYYNLGKHRHAFILNGLVHLFLVDSPAVKIGNVQPEQSIRNGPKMDKIFNWKTQTKIFDNLTTGISDKHIDYIKNIGCSNKFLLGDQNCILEKERLVSLTSGGFTGTLNRDWFRLDYLYSVSMNENNEIARRITCIEEIAPSCRQSVVRYINSLNELEGHILNNEIYFPESLADLKGEEIRIGYGHSAAKDFYRSNVLNSKGDSSAATILYVDIQRPEDANKLFVEFREVLEYGNKCRIVVYYKVGLNVQWVEDKNAGKITYDDREPVESILKN
jgi:hypothetical protein